MREVMTGEATPPRWPASLVALRAKGESPTRSPAWPPTMLALATPVSLPGRLRGHRRHRRRRRAHGEHLDDGRGRHGRRGRAGGQARQPGGVVGVAAPPTCSRRSAWSIDLPAAGGGRAACGGAGIGFFFAPVFHPGFRHAGGPAAGAGHRHGLQLPRPADQPGAAGGRGDRLRRPPDGTGAWPRCWPHRGTPGAGLPRRRRPRRADHHHDVGGVGGPRRRGRPPTGSTRRRSGCRVVGARRAARRRPGRQRRGRSAGWSPVSPARCATRCCSTPRAALAAFDERAAPAARRAAAPVWRGPRRRSTTAGPRPARRVGAGQPRSAATAPDGHPAGGPCGNGVLPQSACSKPIEKAASRSCRE